MADGALPDRPTLPSVPPGCMGKAEGILAKARCAFVEKGFAGASMQDLARAAGMSAGNFYRYFPSKDAIVEALIESDLAMIEADFETVAASPEPLAAFKALVRERLSDKCGNDDTLWAEIAATALRRPQTAALMTRLEDEITRHLAHVIGVAGGVPLAEAERRFDAHARVVFLIMHGAMTSLSEGRQRDTAVLDLIVLALEGVIDDALADRKDA